MTVPASLRRVGPHLGNGAATSFPFSFKVFAASDIELTRVDADGISYALSLGTHYSVTLNADQDASPGGSITYPLSGSPLPTGETLVGVGALPYDQPTDLPSGGAYRALTVENAFDRTVQQMQQLAEAQGRSLTLPASAATADTKLPAPSANKVIGWNETGDALTNYSPADLATVVVAGTSYFQTFSGDGSTTQFALTADPGSVNALDIALDGVPQKNGIDFTVSGTTLTFASAPAAGTQNIALRYVAAVPVGSANAQDVTFSHAVTHPAGSVGLALNAAVSVKNAPFNAKGDGTTDDTAAIQAAIDSHRGRVYFPAGTYKISSTIVVKEDRILVGEGAGAYFAGTGYPRITVLQPTAGFSGTKVIDIDPANVDAGLSYIYGVAIRDMLIDCINVKNSNKTIINCASLSNSETFDSIRVINNNSNTGLAIGLSANASALECDGLSFHNLYFLQADSDGPSTTPLVSISAANEVSFRDSKFQRGSNPATATGSMAVQVSAAASRAVNAVTFDSCAFTGAESGLRIQGNNTDGQGPRWVRVQNCTFEGPKFPINVTGTSSRPAQFCTFGPGNRMFALAAGGTGIVLGAYASNNLVFVDEFTDILLNANSSGNTLYGGGTVTDSGSNNARISRTGGAVQLSSLYRETTVAPTLATGWTNASPASRTSAGYWMDAQGVVHLQGYVGYSSGGSALIFTLPVGYVPARAQVITVTTNTGVGSILVNQAGSGMDGQVTQLTGGTGWVSLDGISFALS